MSLDPKPVQLSYAAQYSPLLCSEKYHDYLLHPWVKKNLAHVIVFKTERCLMQRTVIIIATLLVVGLTRAAIAASSTSDDNRKTEESKGVTVEDLGRGLKSAAQNIEKEIPKIGSAIGNAVKKITEKGPEKPSSQEPAKQNK